MSANGRAAIKDIYEAANEIARSKEKSDQLSLQKRSIEQEIAQLTHRVRSAGGRLPDEEYRGILKKQKRCREMMYEIEKQLVQLKAERRHWTNIETQMRLNANLSREPSPIVFNEDADRLRKAVTGIRDIYLSFSEDPTRVNSMRLMAAQFAKELTEVLAEAVL